MTNLESLEITELAEKLYDEFVSLPAQEGKFYPAFSYLEDWDKHYWLLRAFHGHSVVKFDIQTEWACIVTNIHNDYIVAYMLTINNSQHFHSMYDYSIPINDFHEDDQERIQIGSIFYSVSGYETSPNSKSQFTQVILSEDPPLNKDEIEKSIMWSEKLVKFKALNGPIFRNSRSNPFGVEL